MLRTVIRQELLDHVMSFRFSAITALTLLLMVVSVMVFSSSHALRVREYPGRVEAFVDDEGKVNLFIIASQAGGTVRERPSPLGFCSAAGERELPNEAVMAVHALNAIQRAAEPGEILNTASLLDWTFIVAVILSFGAGLLTYKSVSGERRDGTLALVLSNPVPRATILGGKYIAALGALIVVLLCASLCSLIVLRTSGAVQPGADDWLKLAMFFLLSTLYLSVFVMTGLLCSVFTRSPVLSAVAFVFVWMGLVFVVPNLGGVLAGQLGSVMTPAQVRETARTIPDQYTLSASMNADEAAAVKLRRESAREKLLLEYAQTLVRQVQLGADITLVSPSSVFSSGAEKIVGGGTSRLTHFVHNAVRYRERLFQAILDADRNDPKSEHRYVPWWTGGNHFSQLTVDVGPAKEFRDTFPSSGEGLLAAAWNIVLLVLYNLIAFAVAFRRFVRQDVTPAPGV